MTQEEHATACRCVQSVVGRFQWIETMEARVDGNLLVVVLTHSYPVDIRRELRSYLRELLPQAQIELAVSQVPPGFGMALRGAEQYAQAGACEHHRKCRELWN